MAYFGRRPDKPGSVPGEGNGFRGERQRAHVRGQLERLERRIEQGRPARPTRAQTAARAVRAGRSSR